MRCFVSGATGFVGSALVTRLLKDGHTVVALAQHEERARVLAAQGAEVVVGVPEALDDTFSFTLVAVDVLFHCDSLLDPAAPPEAYRQANVLGTRNLLDAAISAGVGRLVYLSSQAVVWDGESLSDTDEDTPYPEEHVDPYSESRAEAERLVLGAARAGRVQAVAIRPGWTWGPGDTELLPLLVERAMQGAIPLVGSGEHDISTTYIDHLVEGLLAAATREDVSGVYFVSEDAGVTLRAFLDLQLGAVGILPRYRHIPPMLARAAAAVWEAAGPWVGAPQHLIRLVTGMAACELTHNTARAEEELGVVSPVSLEEGISRLQAWAQTMGGAQGLARLVSPESGGEGT